MNQLLQLTLRGALMFAAIAFFDWLFATRISARVRRVWWLLIPLAFFVTIPLAILPAVMPAPAGNFPTIPEPVSPGLSPAVASSGAGNPAAVGSVPRTGGPSVLSLVVAAGAGAYLLVVVIRTRLVLRRWGKSRLCTDPALLGVLEDCKARANITAPIGLVVSDAASAPVILGWLRPRILLPDSLVASMSGEQLRGVLFHELAHFQSLDIPCGWLFTLACALHWFNPAAHLALRAWTRFREEAADETAIAWLGQPSGVAYGETLLHVLRATHESRPIPFTSLAIVESRRSRSSSGGRSGSPRRRPRAGSIRSAAR